MLAAKQSKQSNDNIIFQRRNPVRNHFVNTSKVLLYGYKALSDGARVTYQVIDGHDWEDKETGDTKGYAYPASQTLAELRGVSKRTIERHIAELEQIGLISRQQRRNQPSILFIEDVSEEEIGAYLRQVQERRNTAHPKTSTAEIRTVNRVAAQSNKLRTTKLTRDDSVVPTEHTETPKMSFAYKEEKTQSEEQQQVVAQLGVFKIGNRKATSLLERHGFEHIRQKVHLLQWKRAHTNRQPILDTAAWLIRAIEEDYQLPPELDKLELRTRKEVLSTDEREGVVTIVERTLESVPPFE